MTETATNGSVGKAEDGRVFSLRKVYVKDLSFEAPNSPAFFLDTRPQPEVSLNIRTSHSDLGGGSIEVVLHMTAQSVTAERTAFLIEVAQAGLFHVSGFSKEEARAIIGVHCPNTLFPYARETISSLVQRGGYPPLLLQPMDFAALFAQANLDAAANQTAQA